MARTRSYKLLCPIARGLDRIGDRWTLLILRDLHAGPARFSDLQKGLTGIAANLLTDRLAKLLADGLIQKASGPHGAALYELTDLGRRTRDILFDLAMFGARFAPETEVVRPGNLRTIATTLGTACARAVTPKMDFEAAIVVDGEDFALTARDGVAGMLYQSADHPDVRLETSYEAMMRLADGQMDQQSFVRDHCRIEILTPGKEVELSGLLAGAFEVMRS